MKKPTELWTKYDDGTMDHMYVESSQRVCFCKLWETIKNRFVVEDQPQYLKGKDNE
jgi:hypothetical protein